MSDEEKADPAAPSSATTVASDAATIEPTDAQELQELTQKVEEVKLGEEKKASEKPDQPVESAPTTSETAAGEKSEPTSEIDAAGQSEDTKNSKSNEGEPKGEPADDALDEDEIEESPAFIPKKGKYYMHDSRDDAGEELESRKSRADGAWRRDKFDPRSQRPKSKKQLVAKYGFDIRDGETVEEAEERQKKSADRKEKEPVATVVKEDSHSSPGVRRGGGQARGGQRKPPPRKFNESDDRDRDNGVEANAGRTKKPRNESQADRIDVDDDSAERAGVRRRRPGGKPVSVPVRNVRGGRGASNGVRNNRMNDRRPPPNRREFRDYDRDDRDRPERPERRSHDEPEYENHRRGATRGSIRGASQGPASRQYVRTFSSSKYDRDNVPPPRETFGERSNGYGGYERTGYNRGGFRGHSDYGVRGGGYTRGGSRGGYRGRGGMTNGAFRGTSAGPKRFPNSRYDGPPGDRQPYKQGSPAFNSTGTPPGPLPPRQPTDAVFFDVNQQINRAPPPPREKKIIEIVKPTS